MNKKSTQQEKALQLHQLHNQNTPIILPNIWDVMGAKLLENLGYRAVATASAAIAYTNGYLDGEKIPFNELLSILARITNKTNLPVTADIESGYTADNAQLKENIKLLIQSGIVGINIEDTNHETKKIYTIEDQCTRIRLVRDVSKELNLPLFINARADVLLYDDEFPTDDLRLEELIKRGLAYKAAGANCFFPIALKQKDAIQELVKQLNMPINILTLPGIPDLKILKEMGVARISLGPSFLKIAVRSMKSLATELKNLRGLSAIAENEITSEYLKKLVNG